MGEFLKDLELTEGRSTGVPKIIYAMKKNGSPEASFETDDERSYFLIRLPIHQEAKQTDLDTDLDTPLDRANPIGRLLHLLTQEAQSISQLMQQLHIQHKPHFRKSYLSPALEQGLIEMTLPEKPTSRHQQYRLTPKGLAYLTQQNKDKS